MLIKNRHYPLFAIFICMLLDKILVQSSAQSLVIFLNKSISDKRDAA
jgi:hypothetical protein